MRTCIICEAFYIPAKHQAKVQKTCGGPKCVQENRQRAIRARKLETKKLMTGKGYNEDGSIKAYYLTRGAVSTTGKGSSIDQS